MPSRLKRLVDRVVTLHEGEAPTALLMFAYSFLAMTSYNILKPITRSKFIGALGADNLPYVQLAAGVLIGLLMQLYGRAIVRVPRRWAIPVTQAGQATLLVAFWLLFRTDADWVSVAFYVLVWALGILLISQFWTLANDIYNPRQARRLFGFIGGGASLGGATGAALTALAVREVGTDDLLLVSAGVLALSTAIVSMIIRRHALAERASAAPEEPALGGGETLRLLRSSRHVQVIALVIGFAAIGAGIIEQQLNMAVEATAGAASTDAITGFLAQVTFYLSLVSFAVQIGLTSQIHQSLGLIVALLVLPISLGTTAVVILVSGALWAPAAARVLDTSLRYSLDKTTREVLFLPLPVDVKYRIKPFVDVTMDRIAKAAGAVLMLTLIKPWGLGLDWQQLSYTSLVVTALWIALVILARSEYLKAFRRSLGSRALEPGSMRVDVSDATTIETLVEELSHPDDSRVVYAIDLLESLDKRHLITPLLLHHDSPHVRARALRTLETASSSLAERWTPAAERLLKDDDADVRAAAVRALAALRGEEASTLMRQYLDDPEPRVMVTAAVALADSGSAEDAALAELALKGLIEDTRDAAAGARHEAAAALGTVRNPRVRTLLVPLMHDPSVSVARAAIRSARVAAPVDVLLLPGLIALLGHRVLKADAREALVSYGDHAIEALAHFLTDPGEHIWVRRHIPATLALLPTPRSVAVLTDALDDPDGFLRYKIVAAIERLRREQPALAFRTGPAEALVLRESSRYYSYLSLRYNIVSHDADLARSLLVRALDDKLARTLDRIYRLLGLIYSVRDVAAARYTIEHGDGRRRAGAIEYLDNLLGGAIRKRVLPILEDLPMADKVRKANLILKSRPRDLEDTVAQLVHDDDPVVAASGIQFVERRRLWSLSDDLDFVLAHRATADRHVLEAASWARAGRQLSAERRRHIWTDPLPAVELADRLRAIPLFDFVSVDELFRIAAMGRQVRHEAGREISHEGGRSHEVQFLLDGGVRLSSGDGRPRDLDAPAALGFEEMLEGSPLQSTVRARTPAICLTIAGGEFLTTLSDDIVLAQGLFRMLLDAPKARRWRVAYAAPRAAVSRAPDRSLKPIEKVLLLRQNPLFARATVDQLLNLATIAHEVPITRGQVLIADTDPPAIYHVLTGALRLDADGADPIVAGPGFTIGMAESLAAVSLGRSAVVTEDGRVLRLDHRALFDVLEDHIDLLQGLFSGVLSAGHPEEPGSSLAT